MKILVVGPFEDWVTTGSEEVVVHRAANADDAIKAIGSWQPHLIVVDPTVIGSARDSLVARAESVGSTVIAPPRAQIRIPGSTIQELEQHAILETLKAVDGSTSRAARMLGISVRKIQYRLRSWRDESKKAAGREAGKSVN